MKDEGPIKNWEALQEQEDTKGALGFTHSDQWQLRLLGFVIVREGQSRKVKGTCVPIAANRGEAKQYEGSIKDWEAL